MNSPARHLLTFLATAYLSLGLAQSECDLSGTLWGDGLKRTNIQILSNEVSRDLVGVGTIDHENQVCILARRRQTANFEAVTNFFPPDICRGTVVHDTPGLLMPTLIADSDGFLLGQLSPVKSRTPSELFTRGLSELKEDEQLGVYVVAAEALSFNGLCSFGGFRSFDTSVNLELSKGSNLLVFSLVDTESGKRLLLNKGDATNLIWIFNPR